jgi:CRP-like cAMP-binding protein
MATNKARQRTQSTSEEELRQGLNEFVAFSRELDGVDLRVYLYTSGRVNFTEPVHLPQVEMATMLGRRQTHISRALRNLVAAGVLVPGPDGTRGSKWMLNAEYGK